MLLSRFLQQRVELLARLCVEKAALGISSSHLLHNSMFSNLLDISLSRAAHLWQSAASGAQRCPSSPLRVLDPSGGRCTGMCPKLLLLGQMCGKTPSTSMPSVFAVPTNLHQIFSVPLQNYLCIALFTGSMLFYFTILYLFSFPLVFSFFFLFLINGTRITFSLFLLEHSQDRK